MTATRTVYVRDIPIGGHNPVVVQSMCAERLENTKAIISEIETLAEAGARIVRFAVRNMHEARLIPEVVRHTTPALCADIHFDHRLALEAIKGGVHKVRINPGNIGSLEKTKEVVRAAREHSIPIRIGVNGGSLDRIKYPKPNPQALVDSALYHVEILEDLDFTDIVISLKSSDVHTTVLANRLMVKRRNYPLHLGVTEAGFGLSAVIKSSIAIGSLLVDGIGSTIRVSMTGNSVDEIDAAYRILGAVGLAGHGINMISCPTCGRTDRSVDLASLAGDVEELLMKRFGERLASGGIVITVAVMGCEVNGPGEACDADIGIAGAGKSTFLLFKKGQSLGRVAGESVLESLSALMDDILSERGV
ncbi:MAG: flavodoxin-dependent (E)-4-hydroxy-3-methylbut-2-enyl-diphosphate synthase [Spirochaetota bacterium]